MVTGYSGTYRGVVVDDADPMQQGRMGVVVPDVYGDGVSVWAAALQSSAASLPAIGDLVLISFEEGDTDYPIWAPHFDAEQSAATTGYVGKYRASVIGKEDPMQENRLEVIVAEVYAESMWAKASDDVRYGDTPELGAEVWIEYEYGDPAYPVWVGLA